MYGLKNIVLLNFLWPYISIYKRTTHLTQVQCGRNVIVDTCICGENVSIGFPNYHFMTTILFLGDIQRGCTELNSNINNILVYR